MQRKTFEPGQKIGAYRIVRLLGEGGMGAVYDVARRADGGMTNVVKLMQSYDERF